MRALSASARPVLLGCAVFVALLAGPVRAGKGAPSVPAPVRVDGPGGVAGLPADFPAWHFRRYRPSGPGRFVVALDPAKSGPWIVAFDAHGHPRWWYRPKTPALQAQILADGTVVSSRTFHDGYGIDPRMAEEVHSLSGRLLGLIRTHGSITDGHELQPAPSGGFYLDSYPIKDNIDLRRFGGPRHAAVAFGEIQELSRSGRLLWRWKSRGHIRLAETGRWWRHNILHNPHRVDGHPTYDSLHINSVEPWGDRQVIISARHTDAVFGVSKPTGEVLWKLGGTHTRRSLRVIGDPYAPQIFGGQHDARIHAGNLLSVYDDATHRDQRPRAAFYRLDLRRRTATFVDQLTDPQVHRSHCCGSVRPFDGGWLVDWGDNRLLTAFNARGQITFRLRMATSSYRAVPVPAAVGPGRLERAMARSARRG